MFRALGMMLLVASAAAVVPQGPTPAEPIAGEYILSLNSNITAVAHNALAARFSGKKFVIGDSFRALAVKLSAADLAWVAQQEHLIDLIEQNAVVRATQTCTPQTEPVSWGQVRTTVPSAQDVTQVYSHVQGWGAGVDAYILDTGILCTHPEFAGRCTNGANFAGGANSDANGHGTHCAGTVGGTIYGIAKSANLIAVKVLGDSGSGTWAGVIEGMEWAASQRASTGRPSISSMSLGGGSNTAVDNAANAMQAAGVHTVIAAGNSNANACNESPARATGPTTVGSTELGNSGGTQVDTRSSFSNWGTCVDVFAPGSAITAAYLNNGFASLSGTSMACPHVAGALAVHLTQNPTATPAAAKAFIVDSAMATNIVNRGTGSPDAMLHVQC